MDIEHTNLAITETLNTDYMDYAKYVVFSRAIPAFSDGLKLSQRKILFTAIKRCQQRFMEVVALSGYVKAESGYIHGDNSLNSAIVVMAQEFMQGMPYLDRNGQFGWLYDKTHGAPRYIKVKLSGWSKLLFKDDAELIKKFDDNGYQIEPEFYLPILPMAIINGTNGIAVGYATRFTNRNPLEVALATLEYLKTGDLQNYQLTPYANGHTGIWSWFRGCFEHVAPWHRKNRTCISIDGLPISFTVEKFKQHLNLLIESGQVQRYYDKSTRGKCIFEVHMSAELIDKLESEGGIPCLFRLIYRLPTDNLTLVMPDKSIKRFDSPIQYIKEFVDFRLKFYVKRKRRMIHDLNHRIAYLQSLIKFITMVINHEIELRGKNRKTLESELTELKIMKEVLNEHLYNLTSDNIIKSEQELKRLQKELDNVIKTSERDMYINDVNEIIGHLRKYYTIEPVLNVNNELLQRIS